MKNGNQMQRMAGVKNCKLTCAPRRLCRIRSPSSQVDAILATHDHNDDIDVNVAGAVLKNCSPEVLFISSQSCVDLWVGWGVPRERCIVVKPGSVIRIKDIEIHALDALDRTVLITLLVEQKVAGVLLDSTDLRAVNYLFKTPGGNLYHSGYSHNSNYYAKHGKSMTLTWHWAHTEKTREVLPTR